MPSIQVKSVDENSLDFFFSVFIIQFYDRNHFQNWNVPWKFMSDFFAFAEPLQAVPPRITSGEDFNRLKVAERKSIALLCPAQSSPIAAFR